MAPNSEIGHEEGTSSHQEERENNTPSQKINNKPLDLNTSSFQNNLPPLSSSSNFQKINANTKNAPHPGKLTYKTTAITIDNKKISITESIDEKILKKFTAKNGSPRRIIVMSSVNANNLCEVPPVVAQYEWAHFLLKKNIVNEVIGLGCCTLQNYTHRIKKFANTSKELKNLISDTWTSLDKDGIENVSEINKAIISFKEHKKDKENTDFSAFYEEILKLNKKLKNIKNGKITKLLELTNPDNLMFYENDLSSTKTLTTGNQWIINLEKNLQMTDGFSKDIPIMRWPYIYEMEPHLQQNREYKQYLELAQNQLNKDRAPTLLKDIKFSHDKKSKYKEMIKEAYYTNNNNCQEKFDATINAYNASNPVESIWEKNIGFSLEFCNQSSLDYLCEECAWLAYIAKEHPDIIILYPGPVSPAIEWTFQNFHPDKEVCWLSLDVIEEINQDENCNIQLKSKEISDKIVPQDISHQNMTRSKPETIENEGGLNFSYTCSDGSMIKLHCPGNNKEERDKFFEFIQKFTPPPPTHKRTSLIPFCNIF